MIHWRSCKWALSEHKPHAHLFMCSKSITWERNEDKHTLHCEQLLADDQMQVHPPPNCIGASDIPYLSGKPPGCPYWWMQHHPTKYVLLFQSYNQPTPLTSQVNKTKLCQVGHCFVTVSVYKMCVQEMMMMYGRRWRRRRKVCSRGRGRVQGAKREKIHLILQASVAQRVPSPHSRDAVHGQPPCQQHGLRASAASCHQQLLQWHRVKAFSLVAAVATILL